jgi:transposase
MTRAIAARCAVSRSPDRANPQRNCWRFSGIAYVSCSGFSAAAHGPWTKQLRPHQHLARFDSHTGRPSVNPEPMIRMLLVGYCFGIRSERRLCEEVHLNLTYRWFCRMGLEDNVPDHSSFSKNRHGRFRESDVLWHIFEGVVRCCMAVGLVRSEGLAIDASVVKADANRQRGVPSAESIDWGNPKPSSCTVQSPKAPNCNLPVEVSERYPLKSRPPGFLNIIGPTRGGESRRPRRHLFTWNLGGQRSPVVGREALAHSFQGALSRSQSARPCGSTGSFATNRGAVRIPLGHR